MFSLHCASIDQQVYIFRNARRRVYFIGVPLYPRSRSRFRKTNDEIDNSAM